MKHMLRFYVAILMLLAFGYLAADIYALNSAHITSNHTSAILISIAVSLALIEVDRRMKILEDKSESLD